MGKVGCNKGGEKFTDGIQEANGVIHFSDIICWFTWFVKDESCGGKPSFVVDIEF